MVIAGLDVALVSTGVVILDGDEIEEERLINTAASKAPYADQDRMLSLIGQVFYILEKWDPAFVGLEGPAFGAHSPDTRPHEALGVIKCELRKQCFHFETYTPSQVKKHATGNGNASKDQMVLAAREAGVVSSNHNVADAYFVARLCKTRHV